MTGRQNGGPFGISSPDKQPFVLVPSHTDRLNRFDLQPSFVDCVAKHELSTFHLQAGLRFYETRLYDQFLSKIQTSCSLGNPLAFYLLALSYKHGWLNSPVDMLCFSNLILAAQHALEYLRSGKESHRSFSMSILAIVLHEVGFCYEFGKGVKKNHQDSAYYYELSALLGEGESAFRIATFYTKGRGVKRNRRRAAAYFRLAGDRGVSTVGYSWIYKKKWTG